MINLSTRPQVQKPLLAADKIIIDCKEKAKLFNDYFLDQCKPIINDSTLPIFTQITCKNLDTVAISQQSILDTIKSLNVNKAHGPDNISGRMIQLCGDKITLPLSIIFVNIINTGIFPTLWKSSNVTPIHKKDSKRVINNYRPISLLPLFAKIFEKSLFLEIYNHLTSNNLITKNQSGLISWFCNKPVNLPGAFNSFFLRYKLGRSFRLSRYVKILWQSVAWRITF